MSNGAGNGSTAGAGNSAAGGSANSANVGGQTSSGTNGTTGQGVGNTSEGNGPNSAADWTSGFDEGTKQYVQGKGFKDSASVISSYRNLEKLIGVQDKLIKLPEKEDDAVAWGEVYDKLGRPKDAKEYNITIPEGGDKTFAEWAKATFHELGISKKAGEALAAKWNALQSGNQEKTMADYTKAIEADRATLKKEWGAAYDNHIAMAKQAARAFEVQEETIDKLESVMGHAGVMKFFANIGTKLGEHNFVGSGGGSSQGFAAMTPAAAQQQINALRGDTDFIRRYTMGESAARAKMDQLHAMAYPDQNN